MPLSSHNRQSRPSFFTKTSKYSWAKVWVSQIPEGGRTRISSVTSRSHGRRIELEQPEVWDAQRGESLLSTDNRVYSRLMYYLWALVCRWSCARGRLQAQASTVTGKQHYSSVDKHVSDKRVIVLSLNHRLPHPHHPQTLTSSLSLSLFPSPTSTLSQYVLVCTNNRYQ